MHQKLIKDIVTKSAAEVVLLSLLLLLTHSAPRSRVVIFDIDDILDS